MAAQNNVVVGRVFKMQYYTEGPLNGADDCDPPEPGKLWMTIVDDNNEEICIVVHRGSDFPLWKLRLVNKIAKSLTLYDQIEDIYGNWG